MTWLALTVALLLQEPEPVALVLSAQGDAMVFRVKAAGATPLKARDALFPGDRLRLKKGGQLRGYFDQLKVTVEGPGEWFVHKDAFVRADGVKVAPDEPDKQMKQDKVKIRSKGVGGAVATLRGLLKDPSLPKALPAISPMLFATVATTRPAFSWRAQAGADNYAVTLLDEDDQTLWQAEAIKPSLAYPEREKSLQAGGKYYWHVYPVTAKQRGKAMASGQFTVLSKNELADLPHDVEQLLKSGHADDMFLAALLYEAHHTLDEALAVYERLAKKAPGEPAFHIALARLYQRAGRMDLAVPARLQAAKLGASQADLED